MGLNPTGHDNNTDAATAMWLQCLQDAGKVEEAINIVNNYVATWSEEQLLALPPECRPTKVATADGLAHMAYQLVQEQCRNADGSGMVNRLATVFGGASHRVSQIIGEARQEAESRAFFKSLTPR